MSMLVYLALGMLAVAVIFGLSTDVRATARACFVAVSSRRSSERCGQGGGRPSGATSGRHSHRGAFVARDLARIGRAFPGGSKGGRQPPSPAPLYPQGVGWLPATSGSGASCLEAVAATPDRGAHADVEPCRRTASGEIRPHGFPPGVEAGSRSGFSAWRRRSAIERKARAWPWPRPRRAAYLALLTGSCWTATRAQ